LKRIDIRRFLYLDYILRGMTSDYMTEDQRYAAQRAKVLVCRTEPLSEELTIAGPIKLKSPLFTNAEFVSDCPG